MASASRADTPQPLVRCAAAAALLVTAWTASACRSPRPLAAPPAASSNVVLTDVTTRDDLVLGNRDLLGSLSPTPTGLVLRWRRADSGADAELHVELPEPPTRVELLLERATVEVATATASLEAFCAATEPVAMLRCRGVRPAMRWARPAAAPPTPEPGVGEAADSAWLEGESDDGSKWAAAVRWRARGGDLEVALALASTADGPDPLAAARARVAGALDRGYLAVQLQHRGWWRLHWGTGRVVLPDAALQQRYDIARYHAGCGVPPTAAADAAAQQALAHVRAGRPDQALALWREAALPAAADPAWVDVVGAMCLGVAGEVFEVFPTVSGQWLDVEFEDLRLGALRVSAVRQGGRVRSVRVYADRAAVVRMRNPFGDHLVFWNGQVATAGGVCSTVLERGEELKASVVLGGLADVITSG